MMTSHPASCERLNFSTEVRCHVSSTSRDARDAPDAPITISVCGGGGVTSARDVTASAAVVELAHKTTIQWYVAEPGASVDRQAALASPDVPRLVECGGDSDVSIVGAPRGDDAVVHQENPQASPDDVDSTSGAREPVTNEAGDVPPRKRRFAIQHPLTAVIGEWSTDERAGEDTAPAETAETGTAAAQTASERADTTPAETAETGTAAAQTASERADTTPAVTARMSFLYDPGAYDANSAIHHSASATDMEILKKIATRLKLATRRPSYTQWRERYPVIEAGGGAGEAGGRAGEAEGRADEEPPHARGTCQLTSGTPARDEMDGTLARLLGDLVSRRVLIVT